MLLTKEQAKYLESDGDAFRFIGQGEASDEEKRNLKEFDESSLDIYGKHMITNFEELD